MWAGIGAIVPSNGCMAPAMDGTAVRLFKLTRMASGLMRSRQQLRMNCSSAVGVLSVPLYEQNMGWQEEADGDAHRQAW